MLERHSLVKVCPSQSCVHGFLGLIRNRLTAIRLGLEPRISLSVVRDDNPHQIKTNLKAFCYKRYRATLRKYKRHDGATICLIDVTSWRRLLNVIAEHVDKIDISVPRISLNSRRIFTNNIKGNL